MGETHALESDRLHSDHGGNGRGDGNGGAGGNGNGAVVRVTHRLPSAPASEAAALISLIERAAADPSVDLDRLERMYAMYEKASARSAKSAFVAALMKAKSEFPRLIKTGEILGNKKDYDGKKIGTQKQSTYAKWEDVCGQIEPVLARNDLVLTFETAQPGLDRVSVTAVLTHIDGHSEHAQMALAIDATGGKNNAQGWGSSISYGKRYTSFAVLNLVGHDDKDTDGAVPAAAPDTSAIDGLKTLLSEMGIDPGKVCAHYSVETLDDLTGKQIAEATAGLSARKRKAESGK